MQNCVVQEADESKIKHNFLRLIKNKLTYVYLIISLLMIASCFSIYVGIIAIMIVVYVSIFTNFENSLSLLLFLFPFAIILQDLYTMLFALVMLIWWIKFIIASVKAKYFKKIYVVYLSLVLLFIIYLVLPIHKSFEGVILSQFSLDSFLQCFNFFSIIFLFFIYKNQVKFINLFRIFVVGFLASSVIGLFCLVSPFMNEYLEFLYRGNLLRYAGTFIHPNRLALISILLISCELCLYLSKKIKIPEFVISFSLIFASGYSTLSRNFLYNFFIAFILFVIATIVKERKNFYKKSLIVLGISIFVGLIFFNYSKIYISDLGISDLFFGYGNSIENDYEDLLNGGDPGRAGLFKVYFLDYISSALVILFGRGMAQESILKTGLSSHNTYLQTIWKIGIVGVILLCLIVFVLIKMYTGNKVKSFIKSAIKDVLSYVLLIPPLISIFIENTFPTMELSIIVLVLIICMHIVRDNTNTSEKIQNLNSNNNLNVTTEKGDKNEFKAHFDELKKQSTRTIKK